MNKTLFLDWGIPLFLLAALAPFTPALDLAFSNYFFNYETGHFSSQPFFLFIYTWGLLPAQFVGVAAILLFLLTYCKESFVKWRKFSLFIILTIGLGAGLLTHVVFKETWNRPRPRQIEQFGGTEPFRPFYEPQLTTSNSFKSFPSGHCAMGFCFFAFVIYGRRMRNMPLMIAGTVCAITFGIALSITRIAQGGHFFSDTFAAAILMWITAATSDWFLYRTSPSSNSGSGSGSKSSRVLDLLSENALARDSVQPSTKYSHENPKNTSEK